MKTAITDFWNRRQGHILQIVLGGIMLLFIAIMIGVYLIAKQANPVILDEKGKPKYQQQ